MKTPNFKKIREQQLTQVKNLNPAANVEADSDHYVRATATAVAVEGNYLYLDHVKRQAFTDTADPENVQREAAQYDIFLKDATAASGDAEFKGKDGSVIPIGLILKYGSLFYATTEPGEIKDGVAIVHVIAQANGRASNLPDNTPAQLQSAPLGITSAAFISMYGGEDEETIDSLRARLKHRKAKPPAGGNENDYKVWAMAVPGVVDAFVYPLRRGLGTVDVAIVGSNGVPSVEVIRATQDYIDSVRPVTAKNSLVMAPTVQNVDVKARLRLAAGFDKIVVGAKITEALIAYFDELEPGEPVIRTQIEAIISSVLGVVDRDLITPAENMLPSADEIEWFRFGYLSVQDWA